MRACNNCIYIEQRDGEQLCRRFPRTVAVNAGGNVSMLPRALDDDWCGEHQHRSWWRRLLGW